jgi:hypothetical protein
MLCQLLPSSSAEPATSVPQALRTQNLADKLFLKGIVPKRLRQ